MIAQRGSEKGEGDFEVLTIRKDHATSVFPGESFAMVLPSNQPGKLITLLVTPKELKKDEIER